MLYSSRILADTGYRAVALLGRSLASRPDLSLDSDAALADKPANLPVNAIDPDIRKFAARGGGEGTDHLDLFPALQKWLEQKQAPRDLVASRIENGTEVRTRPLCAYPEIATYKGSGSTDDAVNFVC
jgi:hypothetical protein